YLSLPQGLMCLFGAFSPAFEHRGGSRCVENGGAGGAWIADGWAGVQQYPADFGSKLGEGSDLVPDRLGTDQPLVRCVRGVVGRGCHVGSPCLGSEGCGAASGQD